MQSLIPVERIENKILLLRGQKVMLDRDLADLYGIGTRDLNKAVTRNSDRFPGDFMFTLTNEEFDDLMFQFGTSSWGGTRKLPRAFTEQGVAMLSSVLRSPRAVQVNLMIMRAFVKMRELIAEHKDLAGKLDELEKKYDKQFQIVFQAIRELMAPPEPKKKKEKMGFR
ncbi:ORF6N domain-containing protein [bacterium]|nr:ORF6N domain-containing protein [bacterium]